MTGSQWNLFAGALAVSILSLPLITTVTEDAFRSLPPGYKKGSMGMGATLWQTIRYVMLPACMPRIMTGVILAAGRGFGEAAALFIYCWYEYRYRFGQIGIFFPQHVRSIHLDQGKL